MLVTGNLASVEADCLIALFNELECFDVRQKRRTRKDDCIGNRTPKWSKAVDGLEYSIKRHGYHLLR
ncbi:hypothetical protein D3C87_1697880 [compost metagenome]